MRTTTSKRQPAKFVPLTAEQAKEKLRMQGISISEFARSKNLGRDTVADLLGGRAHGLYGESHRAAVALGMKANPEIPAKSRTAARAKRA